MCSNSSWFLIAASWSLTLCTVVLSRLVVWVSRVDVRLHHLVLLLYNFSCWKSHGLIAFLARLANSLESCIFMAWIHIRLHLVQRLRSKHRICPIRQLILRSRKLGHFCDVAWLLRINLEAVGCLELLRLAVESGRLGRTRSVPGNFARSLVPKD